MNRRVVITGMGLHTPLGDDPDTVFQALLDDRSASVVMPDWVAFDDLETHVGAPVPNFDGKHIPRKARRTMGRVAQLAVSAAEKAIQHANAQIDDLQGGRTGVFVGSTGGSSATEYQWIQHLVTKQSARGLKSTSFFQAMSHTAAANVAIHLGIDGEMYATNSACASASQAIGLATQRIRDGYLDAALAGGAEELHLLGAIIFQSIGAASAGFNDAPGSTPRPFDAGRDGIVVGEGAGILLLEERERALARGATILAEVIGHATSTDAVHIVNPAPEGMAKTIRNALSDAGINASEVDYINAHATGTREGDASEAAALLDVFGDQTPVSSSKGHLGHTLGACGAIEAAICVSAMNRGIAPGTRNLTTPDTVPIRLLSEPLEGCFQTVLSTSFAFGGVNSCLLLHLPNA